MTNHPNCVASALLLRKSREMNGYHSCCHRAFAEQPASCGPGEWSSSRDPPTISYQCNRCKPWRFLLNSYVTRGFVLIAHHSTQPFYRVWTDPSIPSQCLLICWHHRAAVVHIQLQAVQTHSLQNLRREVHQLLIIDTSQRCHQNDRMHDSVMTWYSAHSLISSRRCVWQWQELC